MGDASVSEITDIVQLLEKGIIYYGYNYHNGSNSSVLKNKYGLIDAEAFKKRCTYDVVKAIVNLKQEPLPEWFDTDYLKFIHKRLYDNVFE
ncbi:hypothetical protein [Bartonella clarridgeiae]|uniref:hypothetical protein n=1 Tax=Bartonella clarridgeiae TaxID=56426 RepID=UPI0002FBA7B7|nr:hypothetical protein [Bartonella clarridgeiae]WCR55459.1 MAG: Putative cell filamentation protein [Bartonella clarridgeiae]